MLNDVGLRSQLSPSQDQTNVIGGFKIGRSKAGKIPLDLQIQRLQVDESTLKELNERLVLVYSGTARLAKNLLQNVLQRWARRSKEIVNNMRNLVHGAERAAVAISEKGDIEEVGRCMSEYRQQKKIMIGTDDAEPAHVTHLIEALSRENAISGGVLLGAGGGGYLALVAAKGWKGMELKAIAEELCNGQDNGLSIESCTWHDCSVCEEGLRVMILEECTENAGFLLEWQKPAS